MTVEISLKNPIPSGSLTGELSGLAYVETFKEIKALLKEGKPVYIRIDDGDRKGSIAKFITDDPEHIKASYEKEYDRWATENRFYCRVYAFGHLIWDGRRNKIQYHLGYDKCTYLQDYEGPTKYQIVDRKAINDMILKKSIQYDMNGVILDVGDKVIYANIRYGNGTQLTNGTIHSFEMKSGSIVTVVKNDDGDEFSKISNSELLIFKK